MKVRTVALCLMFVVLHCDGYLMPSDYHARMEGTTCNIHRPTDNCDPKEIRYILRVQKETKEQRFEKYEHLFALTHHSQHEHSREDATYTWVLKRLNILEQYVVGIDGGQKLEHDVVGEKAEL